MKKIISLFTALFVVFSVQSCKRMEDENGDLLNDITSETGLTGERFLYREYNQGQIEKEYHYDQRKLMEVIRPQDSATITLEYNGSRINSVSLSRVYNGDSTAYTRLYYYNEDARVNEIKETRVFKADGTTTLDTFRSLYTIAYDDDTKLSSILMKTGQEIAGQDFVYTAYSNADYTFDGENVVGQTKTFGMMNGENLGDITSRNFYQYENYDDKIAPFTLIPYDYKLSQLIDNEAEAFRFSDNNVRKITVSSTTNPMPVSVTTLFTYDEQDYGLLGFGKLYDYRPL